MTNPDHDPSIGSAIGKLRKLMTLVKKYFKLLMLRKRSHARTKSCLLYTSDAADD